MKKINIPSYLMRTKWFLILLAVLALIIFGRTVNSPALTKTAIVLGAGLDYSEEDGEFIVFVGPSQSVLNLDHMQLVYPLTGMYSLPEHAILVTGDKSPREMLAVKIGTTSSAPYFLQLALTNKEGTNGMIRTNVKDFLARSLSRSKSAVIPYITLKKLPDQPITGEGEQKDNYEFDLSSTLVFNHDKAQVLANRQAETLSLYLANETFGAINYTSDRGERVEFRILIGRAARRTVYRFRQGAYGRGPRNQRSGK